jgi:hypothetical protein
MFPRPRRALAVAVLAGSLLTACRDDGGTGTAARPSTTTTDSPGTATSLGAGPAASGPVQWHATGNPPELDGEPFVDGEANVEVRVGFHQARLLPANTFTPGAAPRAGQILVLPVLLIDSDEKATFDTSVLFNVHGPFTGGGKGNEERCLLDGHLPGSLMDGKLTGTTTDGRTWQVLLAASSCLATGTVDQYLLAALTPEGKREWQLTS